MDGQSALMLMQGSEPAGFNFERVTIRNNRITRGNQSFGFAIDARRMHNSLNEGNITGIGVGIALAGDPVNTEVKKIRLKLRLLLTKLAGAEVIIDLKRIIMLEVPQQFFKGLPFSLQIFFRTLQGLFDTHNASSQSTKFTVRDTTAPTSQTLSHLPLRLVQPLSPGTLTKLLIAK